jgi:hypothetical protein
MTVKELIQFLGNYDPNEEVFIESSYGEYSPASIRGITRLPEYDGFRKPDVVRLVLRSQEG